MKIRPQYPYTLLYDLPTLTEHDHAIPASVHTHALSRMHNCHTRTSLWIFLCKTGKYTVNTAQITSMTWRVILGGS